KDACNTATVTCEIKGSVDPNNAGHQKTLTATAQDTCETCSVKVDKQIKCGAGPFIDVGFESNSEGGTQSCLGWNAFTVDGTSVAAEPLTVQYIAQNTGGTALFSCTVTDNVFPNDPTCPPTTTTSNPVAVPGVASLPHGMMTTVKGSVSGLTKNACNTVSVTCEVVGSVDPANPSQPKKITATDND